MKISVGVITYNQQTTIRQTLDSILMQKGDFDLELVIGEDCSTDNTRAICEEYKKAYPQPLPEKAYPLPLPERKGVCKPTPCPFIVLRNSMSFSLRFSTQ